MTAARTNLVRRGSDAGTAPTARPALSFEEFVATRELALLRTATFLAGDRHVGEDLMQDVLERAYRRWRRIDDPDSYVRRALVNAATSRWRRRGRLAEEHLDDLASGELPAAASETDRLVDREQLLAALRALPARQRAVLVLRYFDDLSEARTAEIVGCAPGTVKTHAARGLARLRTLIGDRTDVADASARGTTRAATTRRGEQ